MIPMKLQECCSGSVVSESRTSKICSVICNGLLGIRVGLMYDFVKGQARVFKVVPVRNMGCTALRHERKPGTKESLVGCDPPP
jgi:hypothetical protein